MTEKGKSLLAEYEGVRNKAYIDEAGLLTIGIGHLLTSEEIRSGFIIIGTEQVEYAEGLTDQQVQDLFTQDVAEKEQHLNSLIKVPLTPHEQDAMISFAFNIGINAFKQSTLLRELNAGNKEAVPTQMLRWNKAHIDGELRESPGLTKRRQREIELWKQI